MRTIVQMHWAGICCDEKGCRKAALIEDGESALYLATEPVVEG
jgi:hypothetical protein